MRIVIDMQGLQSRSALRGIGRYTDDWLQSILQHSDDHEFVLLFNGRFPASIERVRRKLSPLHSKAPEIRIWMPAEESRFNASERTNRAVSIELRSAAIRALRPDVIHITSLFEGFDEDIVTDVSSISGIAPVTLTFFDLIPLTHPDLYLSQNADYRRFYAQAIEQIRSASLVLAISSYVAEELKQYVDLEPNRIVTICTASNPGVFHPIAITDAHEPVLQNLGISKPFYLCAGGGDSRKNLRNLVFAFASLSGQIQSENQLVFAGELNDAERESIRIASRDAGVRESAILFTGHVSDAELNLLYNACRVYVFPSLMEGFGLPALEAMLAGAAVVASNTGNLRSLVAFPEATFNPRNVREIAGVMQRAIEDEEFRLSLVENGARQAQKYSWGDTARRTLDAWKSLPLGRREDSAQLGMESIRRKLAVVSPFPRDKTGIATYVADLLLALSAAYEIVLISNEVEAHEPFAREFGYEIHDVNWLRKNAAIVDRVLYHFGNSKHHDFMFGLLRDVPGVVVLHDFYLGNIRAWMSVQPELHVSLCETMYESHGFESVRELNRNVEDAILKFPMNFDVVRNSFGVILHSNFAASLAGKFYSQNTLPPLSVIPILKPEVDQLSVSQARQRLDIHTENFLVASFGFITESKGIDKLLSAWRMAGFASDTTCQLLLCGEFMAEAKIMESMRQDVNQTQGATVTGFLNDGEYRDYLSACDVAVQLRTNSRGESSATILDAMNAGKPVIANDTAANGDLDRDSLMLLAEDFSVEELADALTYLRNNADARFDMGDKARESILTKHSVERCASLYRNAIEIAYDTPEAHLYRIERRLSVLGTFDGVSRGSLTQIASAFSSNLPVKTPRPRLLLDLTGTIAFDHRTGIQRVARAIAVALLEEAPAGFDVELVYLSYAGGSWHYRSAKRYMLELFGLPVTQLGDRAVVLTESDVVITADISGVTLVNAAQSGLFDQIRLLGCRVFAIVFDLLPIESPEFFPPGTYFEPWVRELTQFDGVACISAHVAERYRGYLKSVEPARAPQQIIGSFPLGSDIMNSAATIELPSDAEVLVDWIRERPTLLMVGTIEPRKGHLQALAALEILWSRGVEVNLLVIGQEGWVGVASESRRTIPQIVSKLGRLDRSEPKMKWVRNGSDALLQNAYIHADALFAASFDEGYGLPLIEAARYGIPIVARDIPVFHEVAGRGAFYFTNGSADAIADDLQRWLSLHETGEEPTSETVRSVSWKESANELLACLGIESMRSNEPPNQPHAMLGQRDR